MWKAVLNHVFNFQPVILEPCVCGCGVIRRPNQGDSILIWKPGEKFCKSTLLFAGTVGEHVDCFDMFDDNGKELKYLCIEAKEGLAEGRREWLELISKNNDKSFQIFKPNEFQWDGWFYAKRGAWTEWIERRTRKQIALKAAELDVEDVADAANTMRMHWREGIKHFKLPFFVFSDNPTEFKTDKPKLIPKEIREQLARHYPGGFHSNPALGEYHPTFAYQGDEFVLADFIADYDPDDEERVCWAYFIPAAALL